MASYTINLVQIRQRHYKHKSQKNCCVLFNRNLRGRRYGFLKGDKGLQIMTAEIQRYMLMFLIYNGVFVIVDLYNYRFFMLFYHFKNEI